MLGKWVAEVAGKWMAATGEGLIDATVEQRVVGVEAARIPRLCVRSRVIPLKNYVHFTFTYGDQLITTSPAQYCLVQMDVVRRISHEFAYLYAEWADYGFLSVDKTWNDPPSFESTNMAIPRSEDTASDWPVLQQIITMQVKHDLDSIPPYIAAVR